MKIDALNLNTEEIYNQINAMNSTSGKTIQKPPGGNPLSRDR